MCAGQALVQFAADASNSQVEFALKFFVRADAFRQEAVHYRDASSPFRKLLPPCRSIVANHDELFVDGHGRAMPPCIVVERGESLDMWMQRSKQGIDPFTCMQVQTRRPTVSLHHFLNNQPILLRGPMPCSSSKPRCCGRCIPQPSMVSCPVHACIFEYIALC